jgi:alcohol dehydrogenase
LPHVVRYNSKVVSSLYARLAADVELCELGDPRASEHLAVCIAEWVRNAGCPTSLKECGVERSRLPQLASEAAQQWTGTFNPRPVDATHLEELYRCAYEPAA